MTDYTYIASVVASYWVVSISMVYLNKILLSNQDASIPAPMFVTWYDKLYLVYRVILTYKCFVRFQCVITCFVCIILGHIGERNRTNGSKDSFVDEFPVIKFKPATSIAVLPLSLIFVGMIAFNNLCLQYVEVSFCKCRPIIYY